MFHIPVDYVIHLPSSLLDIFFLHTRIFFFCLFDVCLGDDTNSTQTNIFLFNFLFLPGWFHITGCSALGNDIQNAVAYLF